MDRCHFITLIFQGYCGREKRVATGRKSHENWRVEKGARGQKILENHLKKEKKMYKENNKKLMR